MISDARVNALLATARELTAEIEAQTMRVREATRMLNGVAQKLGVGA